jgi:hypothetical protein
MPEEDLTQFEELAKFFWRMESLSDCSRLTRHLMRHDMDDLWLYVQRHPQSVTQYGFNPAGPSAE